MALRNAFRKFAPLSTPLSTTSIVTKLASAAKFLKTNLEVHAEGHAQAFSSNSFKTVQTTPQALPKTFNPNAAPWIQVGATKQQPDTFDPQASSRKFFEAVKNSKTEHSGYTKEQQAIVDDYSSDKKFGM